MPHLYDLMLLIDANAPDERREAILGEVQGMLENGGTVESVHDWGQRRISYEIDHRPEAHYQLFQFEGDNDLLDRLNHSLRIMDGVLRYRIIRQKPGGPEVPPSPEQPRLEREAEPAAGRVAARAAADAPPDQPAEVEPAPTE
jgi:small subunit ribosomal protein S6